MLRAIIIYCLLFTYNSWSKDIVFKMEGSGRGIEYEVMSLDEKNKVILYKTEGNFKTDLDLYGGMDCLGVFKKINSAADLDLTCEFVDQNNDKMWASLIRKTEDIDAGVGRVFIIGGTGRWKYLSGSDCKYAVKLNKSIWFTSTICDIEEYKYLKFIESL